MDVVGTDWATPSSTSRYAERHRFVLHLSFATAWASIPQPFHFRWPIRPAVFPFSETPQSKQEKQGFRKRSYQKKRSSEEKRTPKIAFSIEPPIRLQLLLLGNPPFRWAHKLSRIAQIFPVWAWSARPDMDRRYCSGSEWTGLEEGRGGAKPGSRSAAHWRWGGRARRTLPSQWLCQANQFRFCLIFSTIFNFSRGKTKVKKKKNVFVFILLSFFYGCSCYLYFWVNTVLEMLV